MGCSHLLRSSAFAPRISNSAGTSPSLHWALGDTVAPWVCPWCAHTFLRPCGTDRLCSLAEYSSSQAMGRLESPREVLPCCPQAAAFDCTKRSSNGERSCVPTEPWHGPGQRGALLLPGPPKCVQEVNLLASFSPHLYILCNLQKVLEKSLPAAESGAAVQFPSRTALAMSSPSLHPPLCVPPLSV